MKKLTGFLALIALLCSCSSNVTVINENKTEFNTDKVVVAYLSAWTDVMPDPAMVTHINYAFGHVNKTFDGVEISRPERLANIAKLKKENPQLKILLSIGGWGSGGFSEMADSEALRGRFVDDCRKIVETYGIDGIDLDWEYPGVGVAGISSSVRDVDNFTKLIKELRAKLGANRCLTIASGCNAKHVDFPQVWPNLDFVNIMTYDMGNGPKLHSALHRSANAGDMTCDESVDLHLRAGIPANRLVLGVPFYGRGGNGVKNMKYNQIINTDVYHRVFDSIACSPMLVDSNEQPVMGYDDEISIKAKGKYMKDKNLRGMMYWEYSGDDSTGTLRRAVFNAVKGK